MLYRRHIERETTNILWLSRLIRTFPATRRQAIFTARKWGFDEHTIEMLKLLPKETKFRSRTDFLSQCGQL